MREHKWRSNKDPVADDIILQQEVSLVEINELMQLVRSVLKIMQRVPSWKKAYLQSKNYN